MKSTRRAARSRSAGYRLDYAPGVCGRANHLLRAAADLRGAASVSVLALSTNCADEPWDQLSEGTGGDGIVAAPSQPESRDDAGTSNQAALANSAEDFDEPEPADKKPKSRSGTGGSHPIVGRRDLRFAGSVRRPAPAHNVSAAVTNPGQYTGMSRSAASAYAYAVDQSGRYRW
jgi:hypothetical protein